MADALPRVSLGQVGYPVIGIGGRLGSLWAACRGRQSRPVCLDLLSCLLAREVRDSAGDGAGQRHDDER